MTAVHERRILDLQRRMKDEAVDVFMIADPDSVYYFCGFWGYLEMEFGRPTVLVVPRSGEPKLITPAMEADMARRLTGMADLLEWTDGVGGEWMEHLGKLLSGNRSRTVMVEWYKIHPKILSAAQEAAKAEFRDGTAVISAMRMIKSPDEIATMRQAGQVAVAMVEGGRAAIAEGVPEYELALAVIAAGTRKAAEFLSKPVEEPFFSPTIYNLQILQSGAHTCLVHRRSTVKRVAKGDPIYFCFCGIANFKLFKLGFDREFFVGSVTDEQARTYETAVRAQQTALALLKPGAIAADVHAAAEDVYRSAGFAASYRTGRGIGHSFLEEPQLKRNDPTRLQPGMTFAVDGGITVPGRFGARIGDSVVVTKNGFEYLTNYPRELAVI
jgi:Xaa-Pro aminopeptidase